MAITKFLRRDHPYVASSFSETLKSFSSTKNLVVYLQSVEDIDAFGDPGELEVGPFLAFVNGLFINSDAIETVNYVQPQSRGAFLFLLVTNPDQNNISGVTFTVTDQLSILSPNTVMLGFRQTNVGDAHWIIPNSTSLRTIAGRLSEGNGSVVGRSSRVSLGVPRAVDSTVAPSLVMADLHTPETGAVGASASWPAGPGHHTHPRSDRLVLRKSGFRPEGDPTNRALLYRHGGPQGVIGLSAPDVPEIARPVLITGVPQTPGASQSNPVPLSRVRVDGGDLAGVTGRLMALAVNRERDERSGTYTPSSGYNEAYIAYLSNASELRLKRVQVDRSTVIDEAITGSGDATRKDLEVVVVGNSGGGNGVIIYTADPAPATGRQRLHMARTNSAGTAFDIQDVLVLDGNDIFTVPPVTGANIRRPQAVVDESDNIHVVFEVEMTPGAGAPFNGKEALYWLKMDKEGVLLSGPARLTESATPAGTATAAFRFARIILVEGQLTATAIRDIDPATDDHGEAIMLSSDVTVATPVGTFVTISDASGLAQRDLASGRYAPISGYIVERVQSAALATPDNQTGPASPVFFSSEMASGDIPSFVGYQDRGSFLHEKLLANARAILGEPLTTRGVNGLFLSGFLSKEPSTDLDAISDGFASHLVGINKTGVPVYERYVPHSVIDGLSTVGDLDVSADLGPGVSLTVDISIARAASGEILVATVEATGQVFLTEVFQAPTSHMPLLPEDTLLAEFEVAEAALHEFAVASSTSRRELPPQNLVVGAHAGGGELVGGAGLQEALVRLAGRGGTIQVRPGYYEIFHPLNIPSSVTLDFDPGAVVASNNSSVASMFEVTGLSVTVTVDPTTGRAQVIGAFGGHPRYTGFTEGTFLYPVGGQNARGYYIRKFYDSNGSVEVSDPSMPSGQYFMCKTGIRIRGGTFLSNGGGLLSVSAAADVRMEKFRFEQRAVLIVGTIPALVVYNSNIPSFDIELSEAVVEPNGIKLLASSIAGPNLCDGLRFRNLRVRGGGGLGEVENVDDFQLKNCRFTGGGSATLTLDGEVTGEIDSMVSDGQHTLVINSIGKVRVGDTDFETQTDNTRDSVTGNTDNKPLFTDALFRGNVNILGQLNNGQYEAMFMTLASLVLSEELFDLLALSDSFIENLNDDSDLNIGPALTEFIWLHPQVDGLQPFLFAGGVTPIAQIGYSDLARTYYRLAKWEQILNTQDRQGAPWLSLGGHKGRLESARAVRTTESSSAGSFTRSGFPDRGKIEFRDSWVPGSAGESNDLVGELTSAQYAQLKVSSELGGVDGSQSTLSSLRYDLQTSELVGQSPAIVDVAAQQRVFAAKTFVDEDLVVVLRTQVTNTPGPGTDWGLQLVATYYRASTGVVLNSDVLDEFYVHRVLIVGPANVDVIGELAEVRVIRDPATPGRALVMLCGSIWNNDLVTPGIRATIAVAQLDLSALTGDMWLPITLAAGTHPDWKILTQDPTGSFRYRGMDMVSTPSDYNGVIGTLNTAAVVWLKASGFVGPSEAWDAQMGIYNAEVATQDFHSSSNFALPGSIFSAPTQFVSCEMANTVHQGAAVGRGPIVNSLSVGYVEQVRGLSLGFYDAAGEPRLAVLASSTPANLLNNNCDVRSALFGWAAGDPFSAPSISFFATSSVTPDLASGPVAHWDVSGTRWLLGYADQLIGSPGSSKVEFLTADFTGAAWSWLGAAVNVRAVGASDDGKGIQNFAGAGKGVGATAALALMWQSEPAELSTTWGYAELDTAGAFDIPVWYEEISEGDPITHLIDVAKAAVLTNSMSNILFWFDDEQWVASQQLAAATAGAGVEFDQHILYFEGAGAARPLRLRGSAPKVAGKVEWELPSASEFTGASVRVRGGARTSDSGGMADGLRIFEQDGFRDGALSYDLLNAASAPSNDTYDGAGPIDSNAAGFPAGATWLTVPPLTAGVIDTSDVTKSAERPLSAALPLPNDSFKWSSPTHVLSWGAGGADLEDDEYFSALAIGDIVKIDNNASVTSHRITFLGVDNVTGEKRIGIYPATSTSPDFVAANNNFQFFKNVVGVVLLAADAGRGNIIHPERVFINELDLEAHEVGAVQGDFVDTTPVIPPSSAVVLLQLIDQSGAFTAAVQGGGALFSDYMRVELSRDDGVNFFDVDLGSIGATTPEFTQDLGDGSVMYILTGTYNFPITPSSDVKLVYRASWPETGAPLELLGRHLYLDKIGVGWN